MNTFTWLLKREYWEHRGGFQWAPLIAAGIILAVFTIGALTGVNAAQSNLHEAVINNVKLGDIAAAMTPEQRAQVGGALDVALFFSAAPIAITLAIVTFFYLLGSLYDDRRDRSMLFWKSLPISDLQTVLSKVVTATVVAPLFALAASLVMMLGLLLVLSLVVMFYGGNPITVIWGPASPLKVLGKLTLLLPLNALWALPSIGWLMLCSAWARSKPFLWATLLPVSVATCISIFDAVTKLRLPDSWFWQHIVFRALFSIFPGGWLDFEGLERRMDDKGPEVLLNTLDMQTLFAPLGSVNLWLGVAAGAGMIAAAIWLRRWRDDN